MENRKNELLFLLSSIIIIQFSFNIQAMRVSDNYHKVREINSDINLMFKETKGKKRAENRKPASVKNKVSYDITDIAILSFPAGGAGLIYYGVYKISNHLLKKREGKNGVSF